MDDCLRCHGMHFNGAIRDLVQPQNTTGPWHITRADFADQPTMPCMACHQMHREGAVQSKPADAHLRYAFHQRRIPSPSSIAASKCTSPSVCYPSRNCPTVPRPVKISPDQRQALCYQCHAPRQPEAATIAATNHYGPQIGSGDDRTPSRCPRGHQLPRLPHRPQRERHRLLQELPSANVPLRHRRRENGHDLRQRQKRAQHPLGHAAPTATSTACRNQRPRCNVRLSLASLHQPDQSKATCLCRRKSGDQASLVILSEEQRSRKICDYR